MAAQPSGFWLAFPQSFGICLSTLRLLFMSPPCLRDYDSCLQPQQRLLLHKSRTMSDVNGILQALTLALTLVFGMYFCYVLGYVKTFEKLTFI